MESVWRAYGERLAIHADCRSAGLVGDAVRMAHLEQHAWDSNEEETVQELREQADRADRIGLPVRVRVRVRVRLTEQIV